MGGAGEPVVLLHGFLGTWYSWRKVMPALAARHTVVAPDLRGYGDSDKPAAGYDSATIAEDIRQLVRHLGLGRVSLVGHDMGAPPAYAYAARHRTEVARLAYLEEPMLGVTLDGITGLDAPFPGGAWWFTFNYVPDLPETLLAGKERAFLTYFYRRFCYDPTAIEPAAVDEYLRTFADAGGVRGALGAYRAIYESEAQAREDTKEKLTIPVLALGGELSLGPAVVEGMRQVAADVRGGTIERCGHFPAEERPDHLAEQLLAFLDDGAPR